MTSTIESKNPSKKKWSMTDPGIAAAIRQAKATSEFVLVTENMERRGAGRLRLRVTPKGNGTFFFRYSPSKGKEDVLPLGIYDPKGVKGLSLAQATAKAADYSKLYQAGTLNLREHFEEVERIKQQQKDDAEKARIKAVEDAEKAIVEAEAGSLQKLMDAYIAHLERQEKVSAQDARNILKRNVTLEFPVLAAKRAADITHKDVSAILAKLIDRTAGRTAAKLRSYLRAAFAEALAAEGSLSALDGFNLTNNPAALVSAKKLSAFNKARERTLTETELRIFLERLEKYPGTKRDAILLSLYLGGQRSEQLLRLRPVDVDLDARELTLHDGKGARQQARLHLLPITERAAEIVAKLLKTNGDKEFVFTLDGKKHISKGLLQKDVVKVIAAKMVEDKISPMLFQYSDIRRTSETMMARMGISKETRAHILSHGLGGVQNQHYNKHDYYDEKLNALIAWDAKLKEIESGKITSNVRQLRRGVK